MRREAAKMTYAPRAAVCRRSKMSTSKVRTRGLSCWRMTIFLQLARWAVVIEQHYGRPMDMEWAKDGETAKLFIVQARPETVQSRRAPGTVPTYRLKRRGGSCSVASIGEAVVAPGRACIIRQPEADRPLRRRRDPGHADDGSGLGADHEEGGGDRHRSRRRTSHAAIVSRELGLPAVVGTRTPPSAARRAARHRLLRGRRSGLHLRGHRSTSNRPRSISARRRQPAPSHDAQSCQSRGGVPLVALPADGVGLARMEFMVNNHHQGAPHGVGTLRHA
jgi:pyruvate,water dikinase